MSRTERKTKRGKIVRDGADYYNCKCDYCTGLDRKRHEQKLVEEKVEIGIEEYENRYDELPEEFEL